MTRVGSGELKVTLPAIGREPSIAPTLYEIIPDAKIPSSFAVVPEPEPPSPGPATVEPEIVPISN